MNGRGREAEWTGALGHYAGAVLSRFVAYAVDVIVSWGLFTLALAGVLRALAFPLSIILLGLGFAGILIQREHRALRDLIAGTAVVYAWDARAARLRFLARTVGASSSRPG